MSEFVEGLKSRGDVFIRVVRQEDNEIVHSHAIRNLIVALGKTAMARFLGGYSGQSGEYLSKIAFGTDGTAAASGNTALGLSQLVKTATVSYPAFNQVMFSAVMATTEGGTLTYQELGLLSNTSSNLFSRVVIPAITKSSLYRIEVDWVISFQ